VRATIRRPRGGRQWPRIISIGSSSVTVYQVNHKTNASGKAYVLAWRTPSGRHTQKFADPKAAIDEGKVKATQLGSGRIEGADMTRGDRDELQAARTLTGGMPVLAALEEWAKARQLTTGNVLAACEAWAARTGTAHKRVKVVDAVKEFLKAKTAAGKNVAVDHKDSFRRINEALGDQFIDSVSSRDLDTWLAQWDHPVTRNTNRKRIVSVWRWSQRKGYLPRDARTEAEMTDAAHEPAPVIGITCVDTWKALLAFFQAEHPELLAPLVLAGFCGLRRSEVHTQTWEDISFERKNLRVTTAKRGTPARRMVPLCDAAIEWLKTCKKRKGFICPTVGYKGTLKPSLAIDGIRRIAREARVPQEQSNGETKEIPRFPDLPENCFRHSYISHKVAATGDIARVSLDAGNSPKEINRHYRELVSEDEGKAWFNVVPATSGQVVPFPKTSNA
jgi:integrase